MDSTHYVKMLKECHIIDKTFTNTEADLLFNKVKAKGGRKITFTQFVEQVLPEIAAKKKCTADSLVQAMCSSSPQSSFLSTTLMSK